jgi:serine/threonine protein kinase
MVASPPPSPQWPQKCNEQYEPVRVIGTGGFGSVWMAKRRDANSSNIGSDTHVAIKVVGSDIYSQREVGILQALSSKQHPNIERLLQEFSGDDGKEHFIVLSLARGPTLQYILNKEGALGLKIAQCISKQLISAVSFLHGHAVIHRDISPANVVVSGGMLQDDMWWSDEFDSDGKVLALTRKCKITLIDFGFAIGKCCCCCWVCHGCFSLICCTNFITSYSF